MLVEADYELFKMIVSSENQRNFFGFSLVTRLQGHKEDWELYSHLLEEVHSEN